MSAGAVAMRMANRLDGVRPAFSTDSSNESVIRSGRSLRMESVG